MRFLFLLCASVSLWLASSAEAAEPTYWQDIRPIFRKNCNVCHSTKNLKELDVSAGLALDTYEAAIKGSKHAVIAQGKSGESPLVQLLKTTDENRRMPKDTSPLSTQEIDLIARWIDTGAKEGTRPDTSAATATAKTPARTRSLELVFATNATPPRGVLSQGNPGRLELVYKSNPLAPVTAVAFSPDGKTLAAGCYGQITLWDLQTGKPAKVLTNVLGAVNDLKFSPDGTLLAAAGGQPSFRGDVRLYDTSNWSLAGTLGGHEDVVFCVAFSGDGKRLASASFDKTVRVWNVASHKVELTVPDHSDFVYSVAFSPDGKWLASSSKDRSVKMFDATNGKSLATFSGMNEDVLAVAVSPDGKYVVSSGLEPGIAWWSGQAAAGAAAESGTASATPRIRNQGGHGIAVHELAFSKDGKLLASAAADGTARLWNGSTGAPLRTYSIGTVAYSVTVSPEGRRLAVGGFDGRVRLFDAESDRQLASLVCCPASGEQPLWLAMTPEGYTDLAEPLRANVQWRMNGQPVAADVTWKALGQGENIVKALRGETVPPPMFNK